MDTREACMTVVGIVATAFWDCSELYAQYTTPPKITKDVRSALPGQVAELASWPTAERQMGKVVQSEASYWTRWANRSSIAWIQKIIDPQWLPDNPEKTLGSKIVLLEKAYDGLDTSHVEWEKNGYRFRASQTKTVFYLSVTPTQGAIVEGDIAANRKAIHELAFKLFNDVAEVKAAIKPGGANIAVGGTKSILMRSSFEATNVKQFDNGIVAQPMGIDPKDKLDCVRTDFWWRRMGWWTNGQTLGLFTLKAEGGSWQADYGCELDKCWHSEPPREWRRQRLSGQEKSGK